jgi:hypothetical protein
MSDIHVDRYEPINHEALMIELETALPGVCLGLSTGRYGVIAHCVDNITSGQIDTLTAIVIAHDETVLTSAQQEVIDQDVIRDAAHDDALAVPNWATWTYQQFLAWYADNLSDAQVDLITDLPKARLYLKKLNKAVHHVILLAMAERNQLWPDIQE